MADHEPDARATFNVHEAKTHLSRLLDRVAGGEEITLARAGRAVARMVPFAAESERRVAGTYRGRIRIALDEPEPDQLAPDQPTPEEPAP